MSARCNRFPVAVFLGFLLAPAMGRADVPPPPTKADVTLAAIIRQAGFDCSFPIHTDQVTGPVAEAYRAKRLNAVYRMLCVGGRYLVALPYPVLHAHPPFFDKNGKPIPDPPPEVERIGQ